jgi:hypothetical protein
LVRPFTEEVHVAVRDCESYKSPGTDGINFGFLEEFWPELKGDIMRFITEFHRNGKLTKGINATFIAFIPKVDNPQKSSPTSCDRWWVVLFLRLNQPLSRTGRFLIGY